MFDGVHLKLNSIAMVSDNVNNEEQKKKHLLQTRTRLHHDITPRNFKQPFEIIDDLLKKK